ncbi:hypothetical protein DVQ53_21835 [Yersinia enterocolitica]|nr:hypothetical protein [Yersinia enterocolitica]
MKLHDILSSQLPDIDNSVKQCVNLGEWLLFKPEGSTSSSSSFYLKADSKIYELDNRGRLLHEIDDPSKNVEIGELFYFSDIHRPVSLSNARLY